MSLDSSPIKQLDHIRKLLVHPAMDYVEIERRVKKVFRDVGYRRFPYGFNLHGLYRAAAKDDASWFNNLAGHPLIERLYCPPAAIAPMGRCNWAGDPMFYCSTENGVPVFEVRAKPNQTVVMSTWVDKNDTGGEMKIPATITGLVIGVEKIVSTLPDGHWLKTLLLENDDIYKPSTPSAIREVDAYVGELFTESADEVKNLYWFTSAIARSLLYGLGGSHNGSRLDGLVYPSVESKFSGQNIALKESFAYDHLKLIGAVMYKVVEYDPDRSYYSLKTLAGIGNDKVDHSPIWRNIHPKHADERFYLSPETQTTPYNKDSHLSYEDD